MLESTQRLYAEVIRPNVGNFYGEMYFRLLIILNELGVKNAPFRHTMIEKNVLTVKMIGK